MVHMKMRMPWPVSDRSLIDCFYRKDINGTKMIFHSSYGNSQQEREQKKMIGKDVIANYILASWAFTPYDGGMEIQYINGLDVAGYVPWFVTNKLATRTSTGLRLQVDYLQHGIIPEPLF